MRTVYRHTVSVNRARRPRGVILQTGGLVVSQLLGDAPCLISQIPNEVRGNNRVGGLRQTVLVYWSRALFLLTLVSTVLPESL